MNNRVEMSKVYYRVYKHRGETIVSRGTINEYGNFEPFNGSSPWMTGNPMYLMTLENGKVLCENERDIPKAIKMVEEGSAKVEKEVKSNTKYPSIEEAIKILQDGVHNYKDERYGISYGMALGALKACDELLKKSDGDKSIEETFNKLDSDVKKLLEDLALGKISISEYEQKIKELEQRATIYEFATTETEFNVIKHALARLQAHLNWKLGSERTRNGMPTLSFEERNAMIVERSAISELMQKMHMADMKGD